MLSEPNKYFLIALFFSFRPQFLASPQRLLDAAGPTIVDKDNPPSPDSPTEQKKSELDLLRL